MTNALNQIDTWHEICQQPAIWRAWGRDLDVAGLRAWVAGLAIEEVWFCGAGSSAFLGDILVAGLEGQGGPRLRAVPTTDLVSRPAAYLRGKRPLIVSFGRSGNSAETLGTLDALDVLAPDAPRLNITCNDQSALATRKGSAAQRVIALPAATHDRGFAMTSSFTTMLLTALAVFDQAMPATEFAARTMALADKVEAWLPTLLQQAQDTRLPERVVFLGAGPLAFAAREAALKVMELSAGKVPALWDSSLGFRHGPKSFVQGATDIWLFRAADAHAARYDDDLAAELRSQFPQSFVTLVPARFEGGLGAIDAVLVGQVLGTVWSQRMGLNVDDPFAGLGTLTRVVSGVRLHPVAQP